MKYKTWMKKYCGVCADRLRCELKSKESITYYGRNYQEDLKYFATGSMESESKLSSLRRSIKSLDCAVLAEIIRYRLEKKAEGLYREIEGLTELRAKIFKEVVMCQEKIKEAEKCLLLPQ